MRLRLRLRIYGTASQREGLAPEDLTLPRRTASGFHGFRIEAGLTQEQAAEKSGLDVRNYQRMESLKPRATRIDTLERVAKALNVPLWKLFKI